MDNCDCDCTANCWMCDRTDGERCSVCFWKSPSCKKEHEEELSTIGYEMTESDLQGILDACKPVPYIVVGGIEPRSPQENANDAWAELGQRMGFDHMTVQPIPGKGNRFFSAVPTRNRRRRAESMAADTTKECQRPFILLGPRVFIDGTQWCALYGENLQEGVAGFGDTPEAASLDFDSQWRNSKPVAAAPGQLSKPTSEEAKHG